MLQNAKKMHDNDVMWSKSVIKGIYLVFQGGMEAKQSNLCSFHIPSTQESALLCAH